MLMMLVAVQALEADAHDVWLWVIMLAFERSDI